MGRLCTLCQWQEGKEPRRSFYKFPGDQNANNKLLEILKKCGVDMQQDHYLICSLHFEDHCFSYRLTNGEKCLKKSSLPTLHLPEPNLSRIVKNTYSKSSTDVKNLNDKQCDDASTSTIERRINDGVITKRTSDANDKVVQNPNKKICLDKPSLEKSLNNNSTKSKRLLITIYRKIRSPNPNETLALIFTVCWFIMWLYSHINIIGLTSAQLKYFHFNSVYVKYILNLIINQK